MTIGNNEDLLNIITNAPVGICILDAATLVTEMVNDAFLEVAGKPYEAIYGKYYWDSFAEAAPYYEAALAGVVKEGATYRADEVELMLIRKGQEEWVHVTFVYEPVKDMDGVVQKVAIWVLENTQQVRARNETQQLNEKLEERVAERTEELASTHEELVQAHQHLQQLNDVLEERVNTRTRELVESESRFRLLMEQAPVALNIFDARELTVTFANEKMLELWDRKPEDLNRPFVAIFPELAEQPFLQILDDVFASGKAYFGNENKAFIVRNRQEEVRYFNLVYHPVKDADGNVENVIQVLTEVTEQVEARKRQQELNEELAATNEELTATNDELVRTQATLQQSRQLMETAVDAASIGTYIVDQTDNTLIASPRMKEIFGYHPDEIMTYRAAVEQVTEDYRQHVINSFETSYAGGTPFLEEYTIIRHHDKQVRWIRSLGKADTTTIPGKTFLSGALVDITEQVKARQAEQRMNEELSTMNKELLEANEELLLAQDKYIDATNQSEKDREDLQFTIDAAGLATFDIDPRTNRFLFNHLLEAWSGFEQGEEIALQTGIDTIAEPDRERVIKALSQAMQFESGGNFDVEYVLINPKTQVPKAVRARGKTLFDGKGEAVRLSGVIQDISEQKKDEQRKNDFIGMVSHEMKTPLTSLGGYLQLLQLKTASGDAFAAGMLNKAYKQVGKMTTLINGFLNVSRLESGKIQIDKTRFDMAVLVKESEEEAVAMYNTHRIVFAPVAETFVDADKDKIGQVINNLMSNAVKYSPANTLVNVACVTRDGMAVVSVKDEGIGIKPEDHLKLFDRYYRVNHDATSSPSGFGIGLYLCCEIIKRHDGKIWVESEVGKGSTFLFSLPVV